MGLRLVLVTAGAVAALALSGQANAVQPCTRIHTVGGLKYRTFCGPARVTLHVGGKTHRIAGGFCDLSPRKVFLLTVGSTVAGPLTGRAATTPVKLPFFSINTLTSPRNGRYEVTSILYAFPGDEQPGTGASHVALRLLSGAARGTFSATDDNGKHVSGTFHC